MLAFKLIANVNKGGGWYWYLLCRSVGEVEGVLLWLKAESFSKWTQSHTHTSVSTQTHTGALWGLPVIHDWAHTGLHRCVSCVSVSHPTGAPVCVHTRYVLLWSRLCLCVCISVSVEGFGGRRNRRREVGKRRNQSCVVAKRKEAMTQTRKCAIFLFVSIPPSLSHTL